MPRKVHRVTFEKLSNRKLAEQNIETQMGQVRKRMLDGKRDEKGWKVHIHEPTYVEEERVIQVDEKNDEDQLIQVEKTFQFAYHVDVDVTCNPKRGRREDVMLEEFEQIVNIADKAGHGKGWFVIGKQTLAPGYAFPNDSPQVEVEQEVSETEVEVEVPKKKSNRGRKKKVVEENGEVPVTPTTPENTTPVENLEPALV